MSTGKAAAQAGHAWVDTILTHPESEHNAEYRRLRPGTKLTLDGGCEHDILMLAENLDAEGAPYALIYDEGHVELPDFDGSRKLTALGAGPFMRGREPRSLRKLKLWRGDNSHLNAGKNEEKVHG